MLLPHSTLFPVLLWITIFTAALATTTAASISTTPSTHTLSPHGSIFSPAATAIDFLTTKFITLPGETDAHVTIPAKTITLALPTCIQTIVPDKNGYVPPGTCGSLYNYYPSFVAAVIASVAFGILTMGHVGQAWAYGKKFCWVVIMGSLWETLSFITRSISTRHQQNSGLALVSQLFVLLAPLWINAFAYILFAHTIYLFSPSRSRSLLSIPTPILALLFIVLDIISFIIQIIGGSIAGPTAPDDEVMKGIYIYMGGIALQQFFIFVFLGLAIRFRFQMARLEREGNAKIGWRKILLCIYLSLGCITIRIFFRLIEFSSGVSSSNPLPFHEAYFYALEAVPMFLAILVFNVVHPGTVLVGKGSKLPGVWWTIFGWKRRRGKKRIAGRDHDEDGDGQELVGGMRCLGSGS